MHMRTRPGSWVVREALEFSEDVAVRTSAASAPAARPFFRGEHGSFASLRSAQH